MATKTKRSNCPLPLGYVPHTEPRRLQYDGINILERNAYHGLFDDCGTGKTIQLTYTALDLMYDNSIDCVLVGIKAAHDLTWYEGDGCQLVQHAPGVDWYSVIGMPPKYRAKDWPLDKDFYFINYELLSRSLAKGRRYGACDLEVGKTRMVGPDVINIERLLRRRRCIIMLDECQAIKSPKSNVTKVLHAFAPMAARRYIATGTPIPERPDDLWAPIYFLDQGRLLGSNYWKFIEEYANFAECNGQRWITNYKNLDKLREKLKTISIRRTFDECYPDMPPFVEELTRPRPSSKQASLLSQCTNEMLTAISPMSGRQLAAAMRDSKGPFSRAYGDLMKAACAPQLLSSAADVGCKIKEIGDLLDTLGDRQLVVWCHHKAITEAACEAIRKEYDDTCEFIHGGVNKKTVRPKIIRDFKHGNIRTLVATMNTIGESDTFINCSYCYYLELDFSRKNFYQSVRRFRRHGQTRAVVYYVPQVPGSLDGYLWQVNRHKESIAERGTDTEDAEVYDKDSLTAYLRNGG